MSNDNVFEMPLAPEAQEALAKATAVKQAADEFYIQKIFYTIDTIERGETNWQKATTQTQSALVESNADIAETLARQTRILATIVDDLHVIRRTHLVWPSILALAFLFLGGASAAFVMHFFTH